MSRVLSRDNKITSNVFVSIFHKNHDMGLLLSTKIGQNVGKIKIYLNIKICGDLNIPFAIRI